LPELIRQKKKFTIYYRVAGKGTELLTRLKENDHISVLGPLGSGFTIPREGELLLIAEESVFFRSTP
jgi:dihydroorotate dehydrogenase electron transfer subunit